MSDYAPDLAVSADGVIIESYGRAHAQRQADAKAVLDAAGWGDSGITLTVLCGRQHTLAVVYQTVPWVIRIDRSSRPTPTTEDLRRRHGVEARTADDVFLDLLKGSEDRDLEANCRCGIYRLDRASILDKVPSAQRVVVAPTAWRLRAR